MRYKTTINSRILETSIFGVGIFLIFVGLTSFSAINRYLQDSFDSNLLTKAQVLVTLFEEKEDGYEFEFADEIMPEFSRSKNPEYFQFWHENGDHFEKSNSLFDTDLPYSEGLISSYQFGDLTLPNGKDGRMVQIGFTPHLDDDLIASDENRNVENLVLVLARDTISIAALIDTMALILLLTVPSILLVIAFIVRYAVRRGLKPLNEVNIQLSEIKGYDLSKRVEIKSTVADLEGVITVLNQVLDGIQQSFQREQRFSSDVAHELRTPIAELMNMAEVAAKWPQKVNHEEFYRDVLDSSKKLHLIVDSLLEMARCKAGNMNLDFSQIKIRYHLEDILLRYEQCAQKKRVFFENNIDENVEIYSSELALDMILSNLLSNTVEYSAIDSHIEINQRVEFGKVTLSITNQVENLDKDDLPHMTESMWRKDQSRSSDDHIGLGLTLVQAYCDMLNFKMNIQLEKNRLTVLIIGINLVKKNSYLR